VNTDLLERASLFADLTTDELSTLAEHLHRQQFLKVKQLLGILKNISI